MSGENNARPPMNRSQEKTRTCISQISPGCLKKFVSMHPGVRMCPRCKETAKQYYSEDPQSLRIRR